MTQLLPMATRTAGRWLTGREKPMENQYGARTMFDWDILTADGKLIAECMTNGVDGKANAAFIARAVNSHADLLAACEAALVLLNYFEPVGEMADKARPVVRAIRAALATARAEP